MIGVFIAKKTIANSFEALNQHNLSKFMSAWRDDGVYIYPGEIPESGTFKGRDAVEGWFRNYFDQFPKFSSIFKTSVSGTSLILPEPTLLLYIGIFNLSIAMEG